MGEDTQTPDQKVLGKDNKDKGRTSKEGQGKDRQGRARTCLGQDGQGQFMGRTDKGLDGLDVKKLHANSSGLSPGLDD